jgi:Tfp pilus assembly protein PilE
MVEMLGVLAIVGVLSVGALEGYSIAMAKHKSNQAIEEIKAIIIATKDLYADKNSYTGLSNTIALNTGLISSDNLNVLGKAIWLFQYTFDNSNPYNAAGIVYKVEDNNTCVKLLTSGLENEFGNEMLLMTTYDGSSTKAYFRWDGSGTYPFPVTIENAQAACALTDYAVGFYFR